MRKRDYKAEYARRKQRAINRGYRSYTHERKVRQRTSTLSQRVAQRALETGLIDSGFFDGRSFEETMEDDDPFREELFWELFRQYYDRGQAA